MTKDQGPRTKDGNRRLLHAPEMEIPLVEGVDRAKVIVEVFQWPVEGFEAGMGIGGGGHADDSKDRPHAQRVNDEREAQVENRVEKGEAFSLGGRRVVCAHAFRPQNNPGNHGGQG